jgi:hypothetical protein
MAHTEYIGQPGQGLAIGLDWKHLAFFFHNNHGGSNPFQARRIARIDTSLISVIYRHISLVSCFQRRSARREFDQPANIARHDIRYS